MFRAIGHLSSILAAVLVTLLSGFFLLPGYIDAWPRQINCICIGVAYAGISPTRPPVRVLEPVLIVPRKPRASVAPVPQLICEKDGDPLTVVPCDQPDIK
ncbi:MAG: hypothetical protein ISR49_08540 [Alphaproteobacteria bacterium]|nr:hypothetical protein [Alphaproteobacteria bacterium]MBL6937868.1 hypothetical protein [Alphaproteobacteria bacterium]